MSDVILVVERPERWPLDLPGVELVSAGDYLTGPAQMHRRGLKVFNLCRSYRYQSLGYYVSLLAEARGHKVIPSVMTIQDLKSPALVRHVSDDFDEVLQRSLKTLATDQFTLSIYFGRNLARRHSRLARELFNLFPAPLLRARLERHTGRWQIVSLRPLAVADVPADHRDFVVEAARDYFAGRRPRGSARKPARFDLALLVDPKEALPPSDAEALERFEAAARDLEMRPVRIGRDDYGRLAEFDALFIRATTQVHHYTYRFARRADAEGLVVIDDPRSIVRCTNKVYLAEALSRAGVPAPATLVLNRNNLDAVASELSLPAILKLPDGSFSQAVRRVNDSEELRACALSFLETSDLVIAQEFLPTDFDWRVGLLDREVLFTARYRMAHGHWQIARHHDWGTEFGDTEAVDPRSAPAAVVAAASKAADLIGDGLYGVDLKEKDGRVYVIEVNDNPNVDAGSEDAVLGDELYRRIMASFLRRIESAKAQPEGRKALPVSQRGQAKP